MKSYTSLYRVNLIMDLNDYLETTDYKENRNNHPVDTAIEG